MLVRKIEKADLPQLAVLYEQLMEAPTDLALLEENFSALQSEGRSVVLGAFEGDTLIGTAYVIICRDLVETCRPFAVVENVVVDEHFRGRGAGKALMQAAEAAAKQFGCTYMILVSGEKRITAHKLYASAGYNVPVRGFKKYLEE